MSETVRDQIASIASAMQGGDPSPAEIRGYEVTLAGLVWLCNREAGSAEVAFKQAIYHSTATTAAARKQEAEASETYARLMEAKAVQESAMEMLRTCRSNSRSLSEEMRMQR